MIKKQGVPGVIVAIIDDQNVVWQEAFGISSIKENRAASIDDVYKTGSIAKVFTGLAILKLCEEGRVDLDDPLEKYLPDFHLRNRFSNTTPITIRSLLSHRSGFPRDDIYVIDELGVRIPPVNLQDKIESINGEYAVCPAGIRVRYSDIGVATLGRIIEIVTDVDFVTYMQKNILQPIGMHNSSFLSNEQINENLAMGYNIIGRKAYSVEQFDICDLPAGNMYSTIGDMTAFVQYIFRLLDTELPTGSDEEQIIRSETLKEMFVDYYPHESDNSLGLTWWLGMGLSTPQFVIHHAGDNQGFRSIMVLLPYEKLGIIIMANGSSFDIQSRYSITQQAIELLIETKSGVKPVDDPDIFIEVNDDILCDYVGAYSFQGQLSKVLLKKGQLYLNIDNDVIKLKPLSETLFKVLDVPVTTTIEFKDDVAIVKELNFYFTVCQKLETGKEVPEFWKSFLGEYTFELSIVNKIIGEGEIKLIDANILFLEVSGDIIQLKQIIEPINENEILIVGGDYDGETIYFDIDQNYLRFGGFILKRK
ncbi:MAG: beta-lactamase family protein [Bacteroidales bacterium]|nr:beta-lactamase family protein [Bacteroidales bacterium]